MPINIKQIKSLTCCAIKLTKKGIKNSKIKKLKFTLPVILMRIKHEPIV